MTLPLRDYQQSNYDDINAEWAAGKQNVLYVAPCRSGKTVVMSKAIADNRGASVVVAHRAELIQQMSLTLARRGIQHKVIGNSTLPAACTRSEERRVGKECRS